MASAGRLGGEGDFDKDAQGEVKTLISNLNDSIKEATNISAKLSEELDKKISRLEGLKVEINDLVHKVEENRVRSPQKESQLFDITDDRGPERYVDAVRLAKKGKKAEEICNELGLHRGEVDLIIALSRISHRVS